MSPFQTPLKITQRLRPSLSAGLAVALLISILLNLVALGGQLKTLLRREKSYTYVGDDFPRELPIKLREVNMLVHDDPDHFGMEDTAEWNAIRPKQGGYLFLGDAYYAYGVSMWHQMHCLNHIRHVLVSGDDGSDHIAHCFQYLRQGILCAADTTLEWGGPGRELSSGEIVATGDNIVHKCRDWKQVYDYMENNVDHWTKDNFDREEQPSHGSNNRSVEHGRNPLL
ncbi:hypothetical protein BDN72DRAFT_839799 [Pluteus cervinus]|uniref:Uncharacterized protein n=1 Tax=Pluteus cervinus TaxID=181527 RepID=A0ACD3AY52_9AGAR|nr:hypothetical protein BDN72DRAFT_839799 [Pluteus cervinus]